MICARCNEEVKVLNSRQTDLAIRRRRECACGRFTTYEIREEALGSEFLVGFKLLINHGKPSLVETGRTYLCECGNEARYIVGWGNPRYCGICDILKNDGKGRHRE